MIAVIACKQTDGSRQHLARTKAEAGQDRAEYGRAGQGRAGRNHAAECRHDTIDLGFRAGERYKISRGLHALVQRRKRRRG